MFKWAGYCNSWAQRFWLSKTPICRVGYFYCWSSLQPCLNADIQLQMAYFLLIFLFITSSFKDSLHSFLCFRTGNLQMLFSGLTTFYPPDQTFCPNWLVPKVLMYFLYAQNVSYAFLNFSLCLYIASLYMFVYPCMFVYMPPHTSGETIPLSDNPLFWQSRGRWTKVATSCLKQQPLSVSWLGQPWVKLVKHAFYSTAKHWPCHIPGCF